MIRYLKSRLFGMLYERHHRRCEDCYNNPPLHEWVDCPRAEWIWEHI